MFSSKKGAASLLLLVVIALILLKGIVSWVTGSLSVLAQAADSFLDLLSGIITLIAVRAAAKQEDEEHPYGHGKMEDFAGLGQGVLIGIAAVGIIYSSVLRIMTRSEIQLSEAAIAVMAISVIASILLSRHLKKVARRTNSIAIESSANNISADVYSALAVLLGLVLLRVTGLSIIDPIIAIGMALYILKIAYDTVRKPFQRLVDARLPQDTQELIKGSIMKYSHEVVGFHKLRTRQAGDEYHIDLHIVMRRDIPLETCHEICNKIEVEIQNGLPGSSILIHAEPCNDECNDCSVICPERKPPRGKSLQPHL
jgi:cation diffusion facilitator family transporter